MRALAKIMRVVDGDTIWLRVRVRLATSAPELGTPAGDAAAEALARQHPPGQDVALNIHSVDKYGRMVVDLVPAEQQGRRREPR